MSNRGKQETINVTPKWEVLYPIFCDFIDYGVASQKQLVKDELHKLCILADKYNEENKTKKVLDK